MKLNSLNFKISKKKKRLGRGIGSTKGKTCGRGHKGQKSRSGVAIKSFEGGQMPLYRRLPKRGFKSFNNQVKKSVAIINLSKIQEILEKKKILPNSKLKLLGSGDIKEKFDIETNFISNSAKEKIEKLGGKVTLIK